MEGGWSHRCHCIASKKAGNDFMCVYWDAQLAVVRAPAAKAGGPGLNFQQLPWAQFPAAALGFFLFQLAYTNTDWMKDLWCSSTVWLLSAQM